MNRVRHDSVRLYMIKADSFCVRRSVGYPVKIELGSFRTVTALFIMILPERNGAVEAGEIPMRYNPVPV